MPLGVSSRGYFSLQRGHSGAGADSWCFDFIDMNMKIIEYEHGYAGSSVEKKINPFSHVIRPISINQRDSSGRVKNIPGTRFAGN